MKTSRNTWARPLVIGVATLLGGCTIEATDPGASQMGSGGGVSTGGGPSTGDPMGMTGSQVGISEVRQRCEVSEVGPRLLRRLTRGELEMTIRDIYPEIVSTWDGVDLSPDYASGLGFSNDASVLVMAAQTAKEVLSTAEEVANLVASSGVLSTVLPCSTGAADAACATEYIQKYGRRLYRRPLQPDEVANYDGLFASISGKTDFATGIKWVTVGLMQSPHAVYRSELGVPAGDVHQLSGYELASQIAYTYGGSTPDEALLGMAETGALADPATRMAEANRLLRNLEAGRGVDVMRKFFREWLEYGTVSNDLRDDVSNFNEIAPLLIEETRIFIDTVVFGREGGVSELFTANFTALNGQLSQFYGFGNVQGTDWVEVERPPGWGVGILAQGSVLASTSHEGQTSPTLRGLLMFEKLLCNERPKMPNVVPPLEQTEGQANTTREQYEKLHMGIGTSCASCHISFDPPGFIFEQFDETGRYRADENGYPIDTNGEIRTGAGVVPIGSLDELAMTAASDPQFGECLSGLLTAYMFGGAGGETCVAEEQRTALLTGQIGIAEYLVQLAAAEHFTTRR